MKEAHTFPLKTRTEGITIGNSGQAAGASAPLDIEKENECRNFLNQLSAEKLEMISVFYVAVI